MKFLLLLYEDEKRFAASSYPEAEIAEYKDFGQRHASVIHGGNALQPTAAARTVRARNGQILTTDGPFAETKEQLGGFYLIEASDIDEAARLAAEIPGARYGCIEVRPVLCV